MDTRLESQDEQESGRLDEEGEEEGRRDWEEYPGEREGKRRRREGGGGWVHERRKKRQYRLSGRQRGETKGDNGNRG